MLIVNLLEKDNRAVQRHGTLAGFAIARVIIFVEVIMGQRLEQNGLSLKDRLGASALPQFRNTTSHE